MNASRTPEPSQSPRGQAEPGAKPGPELGSDPGETYGETHRSKGAPGFGELLGSNLRVVGLAALLGLTAYGIWRGLRALFPEVSWLQ